MVAILCVATQIQQNYFDGIAKKAFVDRVFRSWYGILFTLGVIGAGTVAFYRYLPWKRISAVPKSWLFGVFVALNVISILMISPFYFSYTNNLLPKTYIINGAWGYGGYEAAQYLNNLPDAKNITVWVDVYGVCEFFVGKCIVRPKWIP